VRAEDIRAFLRRPRGELERLKRRHWASYAASADSVPLGHYLLEHAKQTDPTFPSARQRQEDWEHHVRLKRLVDRASAALSGR
jgi:hypothetical protein